MSRASLVSTFVSLLFLVTLDAILRPQHQPFSLDSNILTWLKSEEGIKASRNLEGPFTSSFHLLLQCHQS